VSCKKVLRGIKLTAAGGRVQRAAGDATPTVPMADERTELAPTDLARWLVLALLLAAGIAAHFVFSPRVGPVIVPGSAQVAP
jgi:hypothetical protein